MKRAKKNRPPLTARGKYWKYHVKLAISPVGGSEVSSKIAAFSSRRMPAVDSFRVAHHPFLTDSNLSGIDGNELWTDPRASPTGMSTDHAGTLIQFASVGAF